MCIRNLRLRELQLLVNVPAVFFHLFELGLFVAFEALLGFNEVLREAVLFLLYFLLLHVQLLPHV